MSVPVNGWGGSPNDVTQREIVAAGSVPDGVALAKCFLDDLRRHAMGAAYGADDPYAFVGPSPDNRNSTQATLWPDLPMGWRDDDPLAAFHVGGPRRVPVRYKPDPGPIPVVTIEASGTAIERPFDDVMPDDAASGDGCECGADGRATGRDESEHHELGSAPNAPSLVASPGRLAARRHRLDDPSLLSPRDAIAAAMLGEALGERDTVGWDLVYGSPVVIVHAPEGIPAPTVTVVIERCLRRWPLHSDPSVALDASHGARNNSKSSARVVRGPGRDARRGVDPFNGHPVFDEPYEEDDGILTLQRSMTSGKAMLDQGTDDPTAERKLHVIDARQVPDARRAADTGAKWLRSIVDLQSKRGTVIVLAVPNSDLPPDVVALADHTINLHPPTPAVLRLIIEAVAGERAPPLPVELLEHRKEVPTSVAAPTCVHHDDLLASLSPMRGAAGSLERLVRLTRARHARMDAGVSAGSENAPPLDELAGYGHAKTEGLAIAADLRAYRTGTLGWSSVARGLVLAGPPGVGKSLYARALAKSACVPLVIGSMAAWQASGDGHLGDMLKAMAATFEEARRRAPCILFMDELDSVGDRQSFPSRHRDYSTQVVNAILQHLDGAAGREGVVVVGATNHPDAIDPAILRPGRLERVVWIDLPDVDDLVGMLQTHLNGVPVTTNETAHFDDALPTTVLRPVALALRGRTGADVASVVQRARAVARRADRILTVEDLLAVTREHDGPNRPRAVLWRTAVHEAGHAIVILTLGLATVRSITIDPDGGSTNIRTIPSEDTRANVEARLSFMLAGRAAEIVFTGEPSGGAGGDATSDLARATRTATMLHVSHGLGGGLAWHGEPSAHAPLLTIDPNVREAVERTLADAHDRALAIVRDQRTAVENVAERLLADGYVAGDEIVAIIDGARES